MKQLCVCGHGKTIHYVEFGNFAYNFPKKANATAPTRNRKETK